MKEKEPYWHIEEQWYKRVNILLHVHSHMSHQVYDIKYDTDGTIVHQWQCGQCQEKVPQEWLDAAALVGATLR